MDADEAAPQPLGMGEGRAHYSGLRRQGQGGRDLLAHVAAGGGATGRSRLPYRDTVGSAGGCESGGCGGGALGIFLHWLWPGLAPHPAKFVIVGMAGFFAAAAKTPFSTLVIVSEMTGSYTMMLPMLGACFMAMLVPTTLGNPPIYDSLSPRRTK